MYHVYWIQSQNRAYIGFTVDPKRRLRQHNSELVGGSCRTRGRGPWKFMCVVSGFRTQHEALCFEWRWQFDTKRCRSTKARRRALDILMSRERWTQNSPLASEVPLTVEDNPLQYGFPPDNYEAFRPPLVSRTKPRGVRYKRYGGTY